jgi:phenylalanyl-tRNA synthetase beta chain
LGRLDPAITSSRKIRQEVFLAEILADRLYKRGIKEVRYQPLPRFPGVERDFSFLFDDSVTFDKVSAAARGLRIAELASFGPVEIFRGGSVPTGKHSILLRAQFRSLERTLREEDVARWTSEIVAALTKLGGAQRA